MRTASLFLVAVLALAAPVAAQCVGTEGVDFTRVTVDQINDVPQANVDFLVANASTLTADQILTNLTANPLVADQATVEFTAAVLSDPYSSGLASIVATTGTPGRIHVFVRDVAALTAPDGTSSHTIQIVDGRSDNSATLGLFVGDEITVCGTVSPFSSTAFGSVSMQISPISITATGNDYPSDSPLFDPVVVTTDDIHNVVNGATQIDWARYGEFNGEYVRFDLINVIQGVPAPTGRVDVLFGSPGTETQLNLYDTSLRYRNDRAGSYPNPPYNTRSADDPFTPPATGIINLQGFLVYAGDDGTFAYSSPARANWVINPMEDSDFEVAVAPPIVTVEEAGLATTDGAPIRATVVPGTDGNTVASVVADYTTTSGASGQIALSNTSGDVYEGTITGLLLGDFVTYTVVATDNQGAATPPANPTTRLVVGDAISSIFEVQATPDGGVGGSGVTTSAAVPFDLDAVVQASFESGSETIVAIQDDAGLAPFSGVWISFASDPGLAAGDQITITEGRVVEDFGVTQLVDVTYTMTGSGAPYDYKAVSTDLFNGADGAATAEQHEGMALTFDDVTVVATNADAPAGPFGEFLMSSDGTAANGLRVDDLSSAISYDGGDPASVYTEGNVLDYVRGSMYFSFGNYKLVPVTTEDLGEIISIAVEGDRESTSVRIVGTFPNPAANAARVRFELASAGDVSMKVFDTTGREVATVAEGAFSAAQHTVEADLSGLATGVYVVRLVANGEVATSRIAVVR